MKDNNTLGVLRALTVNTKIFLRNSITTRFTNGEEGDSCQLDFEPISYDFIQDTPN
jgi:hypothetical protein